jgi:hypothetical protein
MSGATYRSRRIPEFASREEEAAFGDTHAIMDYLDELEPVEVRFAKKLSDGITVRLTPAMLQRLQAAVQRKGIGPSTLARMWIVEHLNEESPPAGKRKVRE